MEFTGKIIKVLDRRSGTSRSTGSPWVLESYLIESHDARPNRMNFEVFGEEQINKFAIKEGDELIVSFDIDAHEYQGRWFNSFRAWKVERVQN